MVLHIFRNARSVEALLTSVRTFPFHPVVAMASVCLAVLWSFLLFPLASNSATKSKDTVITSSGPIKGKCLLAGSGTITAYLGIPYAEPPVGKLRFQKPLPHPPWSQVLEATSFGNSCPQLVFIGFPDAEMWTVHPPLSEDCLFLNVWVPHPQPSTPVPVLVWIHGGGFFSGSSSMDLYNGASLAAEANLIVVSLNYRLGARGFLSLPPAAPGNVGLLDQQLALKWVGENAAVFGGDPARVTIFGESAGAAAVGFHLLSPGSQPLFARAVLQSGAPNAVWAWMTPDEAKQKALDLAQTLGCMEDNDTAVVTCLQGKDTAEFTKYEMSVLSRSTFPFLPITDGEFLPDDPQKLLEAGHIPTKPLLLGVTADEGSFFVPHIIPSAKVGQITWEQLLDGLKSVVPTATEKFVQAVALKFSEKDHGPVGYCRALAQANGDYWFVCPVAEIAAKFTEGGSPVYAYYFSHRTAGFVWPDWAGAPHGAELPYLFSSFKSVLVPNKTLTEAEVALSHRVKRYWAEFAQNGNPNGVKAREAQWPVYNVTERNFFLLSTDPPQVIEKSPVQHCAFWKQVQNIAQPSTDDLPAP